MSKKKILIHGGIVVNESSMSEQEIVIHDEKIVALCSQGECLSDQFDEVFASELSDSKKGRFKNAVFAHFSKNILSKYKSKS